MAETSNTTDPIDPDRPGAPGGSVQPAPRPSTPWGWWGALVVMIGVFALIQGVRQGQAPSTADPATYENLQLKIMARVAVGLDALAPGGQGQEEALKPLDDAALNTVDRVRVAALAGAITGPDAARSRLRTLEGELDDPARTTPEDLALRRDIALLDAVFTPGGAAPDPTARAELVARHTWYAHLALGHADPSDPEAARARASGLRAVGAILAIVAVIGAGVIAGGVLFVIGVSQFSRGRLRSGYVASAGAGLTNVVPAEAHEAALPGPERWPGAAPSAPASMYLQTVVVFLGALLAASVGGAAILAGTGVDTTMALVWIAALAALWPLARGESWGELRRAYGWHAGARTRGAGSMPARLLREAGMGVVGYLALLPVMGLGLLLTILVLMVIGGDASHPAVLELDTSDPWAIMTLLVLATVWAPLVEETIFRGALYHHLRARGRGIAVVGAAAVVGLAFAMVHPQGIGGWPVLAALGLNFCLVREWRGSLIGPMAAHAVHNGFAVTALLLVLG